MSILLNRISIAVAVFALVSAILPISPLSMLHLKIPYLDKIAHLSANCLVALILSRYLTIRKSILITFLIFTAVEVFQALLPNRQASLNDMLANTVGVLCAWAIYKIKLTLFSK